MRSLTPLLIAVNAAMAVATAMEPGLYGWLALWPEHVLRELRAWELLTHAFLHAPGLSHILLNMITLWWAGPWLEALWGPRRFLAFYLACAAAGGLAQVGVQGALGEWGVPTVGASGAVMGTLVACALSAPRQVVYVWLILPIPVQMRFLVPLYLAADLFGLGQEVAGRGFGVAHAAHLGGALAGALGWMRLSRSVFRPAMPGIPAAAGPVHLCATCSRTERDGRIYEFRYCGACRAEYCQEHLQGHACSAGRKGGSS